MRFVAAAGELWLKTGAADTAWTNLSSSAAACLAFFGNGDNGSVTLGANVGPDQEWFYDDFDTNGYDVQIRRIFCRGTMTVRNGSTVHQNGADAVGNVGGAQRVADVLGVGAGGATGDGGNGNNGTAASTVAGWGGNGGGGGAGAGAGSTGGTNALATQQTRPFSLFEMTSGRTTGRFLGPDSGDYGRISGGGGGGSGSGNTVEPPGNLSGGGGGAGGDVQVICARHLVVEAGGVIEANGGNGGPGEGADCGGGGGGGGGVILLVYETLINNGTIQAVGGSGGASGGGSGVAGSPGTAQAYKGGIYHLQTI
jgi:hypothetical protein